MASLLDLAGAAEAVLAAFQEQLTALGVDVPERCYVAPGSIIPFEGEQLVVNLQGIDEGQPGAPAGMTVDPRAVVFAAQFKIGIVRLVPMLSGGGSLEDMLPRPEDLDAAGQQGCTDAAALIQAAVRIQLAVTEGRYDVISGPGEGFMLGGVTTLGPEGGLACNQLLLSVSLT